MCFLISLSNIQSIHIRYLSQHTISTAGEESCSFVIRRVRSELQKINPVCSLVALKRLRA